MSFSANTKHQPAYVIKTTSKQYNGVLCRRGSPVDKFTKKQSEGVRFSKHSTMLSKIHSYRLLLRQFGTVPGGRKKRKQRWK